MKDTPKFPATPPRLTRITVSEPLYFITFCTHNRHSILARGEVVQCIETFAARARDDHGVAVGRFVVMPDHVHIFVRGPAEFRLSRWVQALRSAITRKLSEMSVSAPIWQEGFFDHVLRSDESYAQKWEYVRMNPVRKGLVKTVEEWPYAGEVVRIDRA